MEFIRKTPIGTTPTLPFCNIYDNQTIPLLHLHPPQQLTTNNLLLLFRNTCIYVCPVSVFRSLPVCSVCFRFCSVCLARLDWCDDSYAHTASCMLDHFMMTPYSVVLIPRNSFDQNTGEARVSDVPSPARVRYSFFTPNLLSKTDFEILVKYC